MWLAARKQELRCSPTSVWRREVIKPCMRWRRGNRLKPVGEAEAPGRTCEIFGEVRHDLGIACGSASVSVRRK
jgi:hypothetical protein